MIVNMSTKGKHNEGNMMSMLHTMMNKMTTLENQINDGEIYNFRNNNTLQINPKTGRTCRYYYWTHGYCDH